MTGEAGYAGEGASEDLRRRRDDTCGGQNLVAIRASDNVVPMETLLRRFGRLFLYGFVLNFLIADCTVSQEYKPRHFVLNEDMIREVTTAADPQACSPNEVLNDLFRQIGPVASIFPTENYYYFSFYRGGKSYSGSLRLAVDSRDKGILQFVCYESYTSWLEDDGADGILKDLSKDDGVLVKKINNFEYDIEFEGVVVKFLLNKIDQTPDNDKLGTGEKFAGRLFDESGLVFDLVYNTTEKVFYFMLNTKSRVTDAFVRLKDKVYVGKRTGFVFFEDIILKRFILIAVHSEEIYKNSPYDGPFDQLPENFYKELGFWGYVYDAHPELLGKLTAGGTYREARLIFGIMAYRAYVSKKDLGFINSCTRQNRKQTKLMLCLIGHARRMVVR